MSAAISGLPHGGVGVTEQAKQRVEGVPVAEPCQRSRDRQRQLADRPGPRRAPRVALRSPILPSATAAAWRDFQILGAKLLDQQIDHAGAVTDQRLDDLRSDHSLTKQTRQRALYRRDR